MTVVLSALLCAALDAGVASSSDAGVVRSFATVEQAFTAIDLSNTDVLGVGEYHETKDAPRVRSAVKRFATELLPLLARAHRPASVIVETWMTSGRCGEVERRATAQVEKTTDRPASTEDEVTTLLDRTWALGAKNHILLVSCDDYRQLLDDAGALDPEASLLLVRRKVLDKAREVRDREEGGVPGHLLLLYGGAIHNDVRPLDAWAPYAFGADLLRETDGRYDELDLLVPEYVDDDPDLRAAPWFASAMQLSSKGRTVLIHPGPHEWLLLFSRTRR